MKLTRILATLATTLLISEGAFAQASVEATLSFSPSSPVLADTIEAVVTGTTAFCPVVSPTSVGFAGSSLTIFMTRIGDCGFAPYSQARVSLGRLPLGAYRVTLYELFGGDQLRPLDTQTLQVSSPAGTGTPSQAAPLESYVGAWLTNVQGEGVFIDQRGPITFVTFLTYGADGSPTWLVISDARWEYNATRSRFQFRGAVRSARRTAPPPAAGAVTLNIEGEGVWYPQGYNSAVLEMTVNGAAVTRTLTRFRL